MATWSVFEMDIPEGDDDEDIDDSHRGGQDRPQDPESCGGGARNDHLKRETDCPPFLSLPVEIHAKILKLLDPVDVLSYSRVSRTCYKYAESQQLW